MKIKINKFVPFVPFVLFQRKILMNLLKKRENKNAVFGD